MCLYIRPKKLYVLPSIDWHSYLSGVSYCTLLIRKETFENLKFYHNFFIKISMWEKCWFCHLFDFTFGHPSVHKSSSKNDPKALNSHNIRWSTNIKSELLQACIITWVPFCPCFVISHILKLLNDRNFTSSVNIRKSVLYMHLAISHFPFLWLLACRFLFFFPPSSKLGHPRRHFIMLDPTCHYKYLLK